jgi:hypothetical protein
MFGTKAVKKDGRHTACLIHLFPNSSVFEIIKLLRCAYISKLVVFFTVHLHVFIVLSLGIGGGGGALIQLYSNESKLIHSVVKTMI